MRKYDGLWVPEIDGEVSGETCDDRQLGSCYKAGDKEGVRSCHGIRCVDCLYFDDTDAYRRYETGQPSKEATT